MNRWRMLVAPALLLTGLAACSRTPRDAAPRLTYTAVHVSQFSGRADSSQVELAWPRFEGGAPGVADSVNGSIRDFVLAGWGEGGGFAHEDSLIDVFFAEQVQTARATGFEAGWFLRRVVEPVGDTLGTLSLSFSESSYLGGARPSTFTHYLVRDRRDGWRLRFEDVFRASTHDSLSAVCEPYFRTSRGLTHDASLDTLGFWFKRGRLRVPDDFALTTAGVRFQFDPYEVAPYALGASEFVVPYAAIRSFARPGGVLERTGR